MARVYGVGLTKSWISATYLFHGTPEQRLVHCAHMTGVGAFGAVVKVLQAAKAAATLAAHLVRSSGLALCLSLISLLRKLMERGLGSSIPLLLLHEHLQPGLVFL